MPKKAGLQQRRVRMIRDRRGTLRIFEQGSSIPFALKRCFVISDVPKGQKRAGHAVSCDEFMVMLMGSCRLTFVDGRKTSSVKLSSRREGVLVRKGVWLSLDRFSADAHLLVCASGKHHARRPPKKVDA
jgi:hypothetical protein